MTLECLDGSDPVQPRRWWRRVLPIQTIQDRILLWAWGSLVLTLLSFACSLLGDNFTAIAFAAFLAASLTLVGASFLMFLQVNLMKNFYYEQIEVTIFLKNDVTPAQKDAIGMRLNKWR